MAATLAESLAAVTGTSLNTAASRYRYALEKIRTALAAGIDLPLAAVAVTSGPPFDAPSRADLPDRRRAAWQLHNLLQGEL